MERKKSMIIGIDLGTTNSLAAYFTEEGPKIIPNRLGNHLTPSIVSIDEEEQVYVGETARERMALYPDSAADVFKRSMGSGRKYRLGKKEFTAEELSSFILRSLKEDAESFLGEEVTEAVISVPAYFNDTRRKATKRAGELAGLVDHLIDRIGKRGTVHPVHNHVSHGDLPRQWLIAALMGDDTGHQVQGGVVIGPGLGGQGDAAGAELHPVVPADPGPQGNSQGPGGHIDGPIRVRLDAVRDVEVTVIDHQVMVVSPGGHSEVSGRGHELAIFPVDLGVGPDGQGTRVKRKVGSPVIDGGRKPLGHLSIQRHLHGRRGLFRESRGAEPQQKGQAEQCVSDPLVQGRFAPHCFRLETFCYHIVTNSKERRKGKIAQTSSFNLVYFVCIV